MRPDSTRCKRRNSRRSNEVFKRLYGYLRSSASCGTYGLEGGGARAHWGKAGASRTASSTCAAHCAAPCSSWRACVGAGRACLHMPVCCVLCCVRVEAAHCRPCPRSPSYCVMLSPPGMPHRPSLSNRTIPDMTWPCSGRRLMYMLSKRGVRACVRLRARRLARLWLLARGQGVPQHLVRLRLRGAGARPAR